VVRHSIAKILIVNVMARAGVVDQVAGYLHVFLLCIKHRGAGHGNQDAKGEKFSVHLAAPLDQFTRLLFIT
jgi:hypothetical protein